MYLVSEDEIKEGEPFYHERCKRVFIATKDDIINFNRVWNDYHKHGESKLSSPTKPYWKKIVASTDNSLGLQDIPETFIKHYVECNGSIDAVKIELTSRGKDVIVGYVSEK